MIKNMLITVLLLLTILFSVLYLQKPEPVINMEPEPLEAVFFNLRVYITDEHLKLNTIHRLITPDNLVMDSCAYEYLPSGETLLAVIPPELDECLALGGLKQ